LVRAAEGEYYAFLAGVRRDAAAQGIRTATVDSALRSVQFLPHVVELDRKQPEQVLTFSEYLDKVVTPQRKEDARRELAANRPLLESIWRRYGVEPPIVVALWGLESDFGRITGNYSVISALATLAYDGRRSSYFRSELIAALRILDQGHIRVEAMTGSWAGAMGQCQFMPSSFLSYAVDYDGDGRRDIWNDRADVLASIANYIGEWGRLGVRSVDARPLVGRESEASLVLPEGVNGPALLVYDNFRVIMKWNKSTYFAASVGYLADSMVRG
jgi:membrane-bound lytic murein transglycosylase B